MKVILTDPSNPHSYVDIVLAEGLPPTEAHRKAQTYNIIPKCRPWYRASVVPDDYVTERKPNEPNEVRV